MSTSTATRPSSTRYAQVPAQRTARPGERPATTSSRPTSSRPSTTGAVRLTRRGRVVVTLLLLGLVLGAFVFFSGQSVATAESGEAVPTRTVVVGEGDTLWDLAADVAEPGEIRETVHEIEKLNSLAGPALVVGQEIAVPLR